jgi:myb proto-oncogene protein
VQGEVGPSPRRYVTRIDTSHPREDWPRHDELRLFELHNQLGNKWAVMGAQLGGRTDNAVKNHFYSRLRKALKRLNRTLAGLQRRDFKEVKPNVLYRIVEVAEEKFK